MKEDIISAPQLPELPFNITITGTSCCDGSYCINRINSNVACIEYIIAGNGVVHCGSKTVYPKEGDMYVLPPGCNHEYYSDNVSPWTKIWFNANGELAAQLLSVYGLNRRILFEDCDGSAYIRKIHSICSDSSLSPYEIQSACAAVFFELVQFLARSAAHGGIKGAAPLIKEYIDQNASFPVSIDELSALISRSASQTIRLFKQAYGITPYEYLLEQKINRAKLMLKGTNMRVKDISSALSFSDEHYFSGLFRKKTGLSPGEYRRK